MSFVTATDTSDAAAGTTLLNAIETLLSGHAAWSFVETVVSGTFTCRVWKCLGTANSWGSDWYLILRRSTSGIATSAITITACESYDSSGHLMTRFMQSLTTAATPDSTLNSVTGTTTVAPGSAPFTMTVTPSVTTFTYWILLTKNSLVLRSSIDTSPAYIGLFTPFFAADWPTKEFPLVCTLLGNGNSLGACTRCPGTTVSTANASKVDLPLSGGTTVLDIGGSALTIGIIAGTSPDILNSKPRGRRVGVLRTYSGLPHGAYYDLLFFSVATGVAIGDTVTIGANTWVAIWVLSGSAAFFINQAAA